MSDNLLKEFEKTKFGTNKYYSEIIKEFINGYDTSRIKISDDLIEVKANDRAGSREMYFRINEEGKLIVKINRNMDLLRFQNIIIYNNDGIMMERSDSQAELKKDINEKFKDKLSILQEEFDELGKNQTIYTGKIFNNIRLRTIKRPENFGLEGIYNQRAVSYDERGLMKEKIIEGTFNVLNSSSISTLEFPSDQDINITKEEEYDDRNNHMIYPNSRSL